MAFAVDFLVVGGGAGGATGLWNGGRTAGGGGGGGGAHAGSVSLDDSRAYQIEVGAGGQPGSGTSFYPTNGGASAFFYVTNWVTGGGGGARAYSGSEQHGASGACGGGGGGGLGLENVGQGGTATERYPGGISGTSTAPKPAGGGGGGYGGAGAAGSGTGQGGAGGPGLWSDITGTAAIYCAGGGGGSGESPGGAGGSSGWGGAGGDTNQNGTNAPTWGAGGGGGGDNAAAGGYGGGGVVIVRYPGAQRATGGTISSAAGYTIHTFTASGWFTTPAPPPPPVISNLDTFTYRQGTVNLYSHVYGSGLIVGTYGVFTPATGCSAPFAAHGGDSLIALYFNIAADAPIGARTFQVQNPNGTSNGVTVTIIPPVPTISQIDNTTTGAVNDAVVVQGTTAYTHVWGTYLDGVTGTVSGTGVTAPYAAGGGTLIALNITTAIDAPLGARNLTVANTGGTSNALTLTVVAPVPTLSSVAPVTGGRGATVPVVLTGTNFRAGATVAVTGGVTAAVVAVDSATSIRATLTIPAGATIGAQSVTVTTSGGTTGPVTFTVTSGQPIAMII